MQDDFSTLKNIEFASVFNEFEELLINSNKAFLLGAGCSKCAGLPLTIELTENVLNNQELDPKTTSLLSSIKQLFDGSNNANIEDYLSELIDNKDMAERRKSRGSNNDLADIAGKTYSATELNHAVNQIKKAIVDSIDIDVDINIHRRFIKAIHHPSRPGKINSNLVNYLVLNYDTLIESALALEKVPYADGMKGGNSAWWDSATYDLEGIAARVIKLHGSIDWQEINDDPLPRRIAKNLKLSDGEKQKFLIWPASTKYRETQKDPYAQLSTRFRSVLRQGFTKQTVLTICGYSFFDSHINLEIEDALRESRGKLTVVVFTFDEYPSGEIKRWFEDPSIRNQIRIYALRGFYHGEKTLSSNKDLPWCKFENITRLLEGER